MIGGESSLFDDTAKPVHEPLCGNDVEVLHYDCVVHDRVHCDKAHHADSYYRHTDLTGVLELQAVENVDPEQHRQLQVHFIDQLQREIEHHVLPDDFGRPVHVLQGHFCQYIHHRVGHTHYHQHLELLVVSGYEEGVADSDVLVPLLHGLLPQILHLEQEVQVLRNLRKEVRSRELQELKRVLTQLREVCVDEWQVEYDLQVVNQIPHVLQSVTTMHQLRIFD